MACATLSVHQQVVDSLEMDGCVYVSVSPDRPNIFYEVKDRIIIDIEDDLDHLVTALKVDTIYTARVIVYCRLLKGARTWQRCGYYGMLH